MKTTSTAATRIVHSAIASLFVTLSLAATGCWGAPTSEDTATEAADLATGHCGAAKAVACNVAHCGPDGWTFTPLADGVACFTPTGAKGVCKGGNASEDEAAICTVPSTTKTEIIYPSYYVLTILYAAPGIGSEVDYGAQSTVGSEVDIQNVVKGGGTISASGKILGNGAMGQFGFTDASIDGTSWEISKQQTSTLSLVSQLDALNHGTDTFYLWTNAEVDLSKTGNAPVVQTLTSKGGATPIIVPVTVNELKNKSLMPAWKQQDLAALTAADYSSLLSLDPLVPASSLSIFGVTPDAKRYNKVTTLELDGPDHIGDPLPGFGIAIQNEGTTGTVTGNATSTTASLTIDTGVDFFGLFSTGVQLGYSLEFDYQNTTASKVGHSETATVTLRTSTVGYHDVVDVYFDVLFNSFAFAHKPILTAQAPSVAGTARALSGAALPNEAVNVTFANGDTRIVVTNSAGNYRVYDAPAGAATLAIGAQHAEVMVVDGQEAHVDIQRAE